MATRGWPFNEWLNGILGLAEVVEVARGVVEDLAEQGGDLILLEEARLDESGERRRPSPCGPLAAYRRLHSA